MKVQHVAPQIVNRNKNNDKNENVRFTGAADWSTLLLRFLDTNQAIGANSVDLCSMVIPRTAYDMKKRGPEAGLETARRESMGTINHTLVGAYGVLGGMLVAAAVNRAYNVRADKIFADNKTTDILAKYWHKAVKLENELKLQDPKQAEPFDAVKSYLNDLFDNVKVYNTSKNAETGWTAIPSEDKKLVVDKLYTLLKEGKLDRIDKESTAYIKSVITAATGGEKVRLELRNGNKLVKSSSNTLHTLIENIHNLSKTFIKSDVKKIFEKAESVDTNSFVNALKSMNNKRTAIGLGIATAIGMSTQPINKYLTFKKTGQTGFVGVPGREEDHSTGFKVMKGITGLVFGLGALSTITRKPKEFLGKIQFKGMLPTIDQLKFVYGMTIMSRLWAARDKDELRESAVKDTLGFLNLLVLGALVTKYTAKALDKSKSLFNMLDKNKTGGGFGNSVMKTRDEILLSTLKENGISTVKDGKALKFSELMKLVKDLPQDVQKELKSKLNVLNISQVVGYLYSGLVLGLGVPALNKHMTEKSEAKFKAKFAAQQAQNNNGRAAVIIDNTSFGRNFSTENPAILAQNKDFISKHMN